MLPISADEHWLLIWLFSLLLTVGFFLDALHRWWLARGVPEERGAAIHAGAQAIAGVALMAMCVAAVWLGELAITHNPSIRARLVPGLTFMGYCYLIGMIVLWVARQIMYRRGYVAQRAEEREAETVDES